MTQPRKIYFFITIITLIAPFHNFTKDSAAKSQTYGAKKIRLIENLLNTLAPNKASKITLSIATASLLGFLISLFKMYRYSIEFKMMFTQLDSMQGDYKLAEEKINNLNNKLAKKKNDTINYQVEIPNTLNDHLDINTILNTLEKKLENSSLLNQDLMAEIENINKSLIETKNDIIEQNFCDTELKFIDLNNEILELKNRNNELDNQIQTLLNVVKLDEQKQREIEEDAVIKKQDQNFDFTISSRPDQLAKINHPYFILKDDASIKESYRYVYEIVDTKNDNIICYKIHTRATNESTCTQYENHLQIIDNNTKELIMKDSKNKMFEHVTREKMFSSITYIDIKPETIYTFLYCINSESNDSFGSEIFKLLPESKKIFRTISIVGEQIAKATIINVNNFVEKNYTGLSIAGPGYEDRVWLQSEEATKYLINYEKISHEMTDWSPDYGYTTRHLKNDHLTDPIINIAIQEIKTENGTTNFFRLIPKYLRKIAFYANPSLCFGILYHAKNISKQTWGNMQSNLLYVYDPDIKGGLFPYCHTDGIFTNGSPDEKKLAKFVSYDFSKTFLYTRIIQDQLKLQNAYGKNCYPITIIEEKINNTSDTVKQSAQYLINKTTETALNLYNIFPDTKTMYETMKKYCSYRTENENESNKNITIN